MLLLKVLSEHDCYGYQITQIFKRVSDGSIVVREPSMYPILYRLQDRGLITSYNQKGNGHMERVYYHIEDAGREELKKMSVPVKDSGIFSFLPLLFPFTPEGDCDDCD